MIHKHLSWAGDMEGFEYCAGKPSGPVPWRCLCLNRVAAEPFTPATGLNDFHSLLSSKVSASNAFALLSDDQVSALRAAGAVFYPWMGGSQRLVCSWATQPEEVDAILDVLSG